MADLDSLSRGELLNMAEELTKMAMEAKKNEKVTGAPKNHATPKDPIVRTLAAMMLYRLKQIEQMSYTEIGKLLGGVSRERVCQLYNQLLPEKNPQEILEKADLK
jgi:hypothetical protein